MKKPGYLGNTNLKPEGQRLEFTKEQIEEYIKCAKDPSYFISKYIKVISLDKGLVPFEMYPYQNKMIELIHNNRFVIAKLPRQSGKTTTVASYLLHYILFNQSVSIAILANKQSTAREILARLKLSYEYLPLWLQQGVQEWNKHSIVLENGSRIIAAATSSSAIRGGSYNVILLDEYAHVPTTVAEEFFSSVYPTITAGQTTRVIMISTPKGLNMFYRFWKGAQSKQNEYIPIEVAWNEVPKYPGGPPRDEEWKKETIRNSSERQFQEEFVCDFVGSTNTLISSQKLNNLIWKKPISKTNDGLTIMEHPPEPTQEDRSNIYFMTVDVARGQGKDYSAFTVVDITQFPYKIVAKYKNNTVSPLLFPSIIRAVAGRYNNAYVMVELNDIGSQVADILHNDLEYENLVKSNVLGRKGQVLNEGFGSKKSRQLGIKTSQIVKKVGCAVLKNLIENDKLIIEDSDIIEELTTFIANHSSFQAEDGYTDDLTMTLVLFSWATRQDFFKNITDSDIRTEMYSQDMKKIEEDLLPFGYLIDGDPVSVNESNEEADPNNQTTDNWMLVDFKENSKKWIDLYRQNKFF
jgi:hypothetical protein